MQKQLRLALHINVNQRFDYYTFSHLIRILSVVVKNNFTLHYYMDRKIGGGPYHISQIKELHIFITVKRGYFAFKGKIRTIILKKHFLLSL